jgi:hypothetical protein
MVSILAKKGSDSSLGRAARSRFLVLGEFGDTKLANLLGIVLSKE